MAEIDRIAKIYSIIETRLSTTPVEVRQALFNEIATEVGLYGHSRFLEGKKAAESRLN